MENPTVFPVFINGIRFFYDNAHFFASLIDKSATQTYNKTDILYEYVEKESAQIRIVFVTAIQKKKLIWRFSGAG